MDDAARLVRHVRRFEQDFARGKHWLEQKGLLSYLGAGHICARVAGSDRLLIADMEGPESGVAWLFDMDLTDARLPPALREVAGLHVAVFRMRPDVNTVVHVHAPYLTAFALAGRALPMRYQSALALLGAEELPVTAWASRGHRAPLEAQLAAHPRAHGALLANHGPMVWGRGGVLETCHTLLCLEETAHVTLLAEQLGGARPLPEPSKEGDDALLYRPPRESAGERLCETPDRGE